MSNQELEQNCFVECKSCARKPGTPPLCKSCLANRESISNLKNRVIELKQELEDKKELKEKPNQVPHKTGFYWAKTDSYEWFNVLVEVYGGAPFLKLRGWELFTQTVRALESWNIKEWGPEANHPDRLSMEKRECKNNLPTKI